MRRIKNLLLIFINKLENNRNKLNKNKKKLKLPCLHQRNKWGGCFKNIKRKRKNNNFIYNNFKKKSLPKWKKLNILKNNNNIIRLNNKPLKVNPKKYLIWNYNYKIANSNNIFRMNNKQCKIKLQRFLI